MKGCQRRVFFEAEGPLDWRVFKNKEPQGKPPGILKSATYNKQHSANRLARQTGHLTFPHSGDISLNLFLFYTPLFFNFASVHIHLNLQCYANHGPRSGVFFRCEVRLNIQRGKKVSFTICLFYVPQYDSIRNVNLGDQSCTVGLPVPSHWWNHAKWNILQWGKPWVQTNKCDSPLEGVYFFSTSPKYVQMF